MSDALDDLVLPTNWYDALPRQTYSELERVEVRSDWFEVYKLPNRVYAIYEPHHFQEVISFLVIGSQKALLIDTGMGMKNIKPVIDELTNLPLLVVNTHTHFDHIGNNWRFEAVHVFDEPSALSRLSKGLDIRAENLSELKDNFEPDAFHYDNLSSIDYANFKIKPCNFIPIASGHVFNLGDREFRVIHTPGHSPDSIMLASDAEKILFTGDTIYPASMYAHFYNTLDIYHQTVKQLVTEFSDYQLYCSHNEPLRSGKLLADVALAFDRIVAGQADFLIDETGLRKYQFDGFAIITR